MSRWWLWGWSWDVEGVVENGSVTWMCDMDLWDVRLPSLRGTVYFCTVTAFRVAIAWDRDCIEEASAVAMAWMAWLYSVKMA
jgi:hypothetical protein